MSEERKFTFSTQNSVDVLQDDPDMLIVSLDLMHEGENRNKCDIPHEAIVESLGTIPNKPIAFRYNSQSIHPSLYHITIHFLKQISHY